MENLTLSPNDLTNLKELFNENYLIIKQTKEYERKTYDKEIKIILKNIRDTHEQNLLTIMKLLDDKERII
ncbi:MAG: hypothetical protein ACI31R_00865 [Bacilli bacterium]